MSVTVNGTNGLVFSDGTIQGTAGAMAFRNRIINGDMRIDQRNNGAAVTISGAVANHLTVDRWGTLLSADSKFSLQRSSVAPTGFINSLLATSLAATSLAASDRFVVRQMIEGYNVADLDFGTANAKAFTVSFWVRSSLTGTFGGAANNSAADRSYPFNYTISAANTWEYKTLTIPGDTSGTWLKESNIGLRLVFSLGCGSTFSGTAGAWATGQLLQPTGSTSVVSVNGATWQVTGVQLEKAEAATSFEYRPIGTELALCQRYYETSEGAVIAGSVGNSSLDRLFPFSGNAFYVTKRAIPTVIINGNTAVGYSSAIARTVGSVSGTTTKRICGFIQLTAVTSNANEPHVYSWTASAEL
jgi:hypothetical protein